MSLSKRIKEILINLAADDKLPQNINELDEHVFDQLTTEEELQHKAEQHALDQYLTSYPNGMEYNEILERIESGNMVDDNDHTIIIIWEPFELTDPSLVNEYINNCYEATLALLKS